MFPALQKKGLETRDKVSGLREKCFRLGNEALRVKKRGLGLSNVGKAALGGYSGIRKQVANPYKPQNDPRCPHSINLLTNSPKP